MKPFPLSSIVRKSGAAVSTKNGYIGNEMGINYGDQTDNKHARQIWSPSLNFIDEESSLFKFDRLAMQ